jgi:hypothetical protein
MPDTPPGDGTPPPATPPARTILDEADRPVFDPADPYWADVVLLTRADAGAPVTLARGPNDALDVLDDHTCRIVTSIVRAGETCGVLLNRHMPDVVFPHVARAGDRPLDTRVTWQEDLASILLMGPGTDPLPSGGLYLQRLLRHAEHVARALEHGYQLLDHGDGSRPTFGLPTG